MKGNWWLLISIFTIATVFIFVPACDEDEDTDDWEDDDDDEEGNWENDDDEADDDEADDDGWDDDTSECMWENELVWFVTECADLYDQDGNLMTVNEVVNDCNDCIGACSGGYEGDCDGAITCVCDNCLDC